MDHYLLKRHAHHFSRGLGDDRVAAGADVSHVDLDRHDAAVIEADARARFGEEIIAERGGYSHADQPLPVADRAGLGAALVPTEAIGADAQTFDKLALRKRPRGIFGINLRIVENAERDRIEPELFGELVDGDFQGHHARCLARRAHRVGFGQVERRQPCRRHAVGA